MDLAWINKKAHSFEHNNEDHDQKDKKQWGILLTWIFPSWQLSRILMDRWTLENPLELDRLDIKALFYILQEWEMVFPKMKQDWSWS